MKRIFFLIPCLFLGIKPYQQNIQTSKPDSLSQLARDTLVLSVVKTNIDIQLSVSDQLDERKQKLLQELQQLKKQERMQKKKERELKRHLSKYENRGL